MTPELEPLRRIAAYALCSDPDGRVLLVRAAPQSGTPGVWSLPGGGVDHGEHPHDTVIREVAAEAGLAVDVSALREVLADLRALPHRGLALHTDRLIYESTVIGSAPDGHSARPNGAVDLARWVSISEAGGLPLRPFTASVLGLPPGQGDLRPDDPPDLPSFLALPGPDGRPRAQRFAAYAVASDPSERVLLTRIADGYPGAGRWHLPGGGTDFGEQPTTALLREVLEETGQRGEITGLLGVASHRDRHSMGPEGYPIDWHGVRAFYRVEVAEPTATVVHDEGGSTAEAAWFSVEQAAGLRLTEVTAEAFSSAGVAVTVRD
ncbi:MAG: NUDIX domain-containing protein [Micromonosporaceae bacterium]|nr:NUDIX domain-containing protein [Micromonosporaceae bacterium]